MIGDINENETVECTSRLLYTVTVTVIYMAQYLDKVVIKYRSNVEYKTFFFTRY